MLMLSSVYFARDSPRIYETASSVTFISMVSDIKGSMVKFYRGLVYDFKEGSRLPWEAKEKGPLGSGTQGAVGGGGVRLDSGIDFAHRAS